MIDVVNFLIEKEKAMLIYPAILKQDGEYILITFPDVPQATSQGKNMEEAYRIANEVLGFALEDYDNYPVATPVSDLKAQYPNSDIVLIGIDMMAYMKKYHAKKVRKNVTIPEWLNKLAEEKHINFSQVLTEALEIKLNV